MLANFTFFCTIIVNTFQRRQKRSKVWMHEILKLFIPTNLNFILMAKCVTELVDGLKILCCYGKKMIFNIFICKRLINHSCFTKISRKLWRMALSLFLCFLSGKLTYRKRFELFLLLFILLLLCMNKINYKGDYN